MNTHGKWRYSSILDLGTGRKRMLNFTLLSLYPQGKSSRCPLDRRPQELICILWMREKSLVPAENRTLAVQPAACSPSLYRLSSVPVLYFFSIMCNKLIFIKGCIVGSAVSEHHSIVSDVLIFNLQISKQYIYRDV
jgi:hypothetical protein